MGEFDEVEVRDRFTGDWAKGFEVGDTRSSGNDTQFRVRRRSDGASLPEWFTAMEIRPPQSPRDRIEADGATPHASTPRSPSDEPGGAGRDDTVLVLRSSGATFASIARSLGLTGARDANAAFHRALRRQTVPDRRAIRDAEFARLEALEQQVREDTRLTTDRRAKRLQTIDRLRDRLLAN